jgi:hypothetical protein
MIRLSRSDFGARNERYAHINCWHARQEDNRDGTPTYGRLYRHEHRAADFALSAQFGGLGTRPMWYAWRLGFRIDSGTCDALSLDDCEIAIKGCRSTVRAIQEAMRNVPRAFETNPAAVILAAMRSLKVDSVTLLDVPQSGVAEPERFIHLELGHAANVVAARIETLEYFCGARALVTND